MSHEWWYTITVALDGILIAAGILNVVVVRNILIRRVSWDLIAASFGLVVLSAAHLSETLLGIFLSFIGEGPPELVHRLLVLSAFLCLVYGLGRMGKELWRERALVLQVNEELRVAQEELRLSNEELRERNRQLVESYLRQMAGTRRQPIRVVIADPDPEVRRVLTLLLAAEKDMQVVGQAAGEQDALAAAEGLHPDVVLMDASLIARDCIEALRSMKEPARVVVLGSYREAALGALTAGASDYVLKDAGQHRLLEAIRRVVPADSEPSAERVQR